MSNLNILFLGGQVNLKNLIAGGFLFVGGAILMNVSAFGKTVPIAGAVCAVIGVGMLLYFVFSKNGKFN